MRPVLRRLRRIVFGSNPLRIFKIGRHRFRYDREVGDPLESSVVAAPVLWLARTFPEAPPALWQLAANEGDDAKVRDHEMLRLLERPNAHWTGVLLWMATVVDWLVNGEAYWLKLRAPSGRPAELWWAPSWQMEPKGPDDGSAFLSHYVYTVDGVEHELRTIDVVHFRFGADPLNPRRGLSPLKSLLREVFTDNEAAEFTSSLLRNMGVPGLLISPDSDGEFDETEARETKADIKANFTGEKRGEPLVLTSKTKVQEFGFSPEQLVLKDLRRIPEERTTAVLGVPAIVAGLGAGLDRSTFTNMGEAREAAYETGVIPMQRILAEDVRFQLLVEFTDPVAFARGERPVNVFGFRFGFDLARVRVLQEDLYRLAQRLDIGIRGGWVQVAEGRRALELPTSQADNIYLRQTALAEVPADGGEPRPLAPSRNGNGARADGAPSGASAYDVADEVVRALERSGRFELTRRAGK